MERDLINKINNLCFDIQEYTEHIAFIRFSGHVNAFEISIAKKNNWRHRIFNRDIIKYDDKETMLDIIEKLERFLEKHREPDSRWENANKRIFQQYKETYFELENCIEIINEPADPETGCNAVHYADGIFVFETTFSIDDLKIVEEFDGDTDELIKKFCSYTDDNSFWDDVKEENKIDVFFPICNKIEYELFYGKISFTFHCYFSDDANEQMIYIPFQENK